MNIRKIVADFTENANEDGGYKNMGFKTPFRAFLWVLFCLFITLGDLFFPVKAGMYLDNNEIVKAIPFIIMIIICWGVTFLSYYYED